MREDPIIMDGALDSRFYDCLIFAMRYAIGRYTFAPYIVADTIREFMPVMSSREVRFMAESIRSEIEYRRELGRTSAPFKDFVDGTEVMSKLADELDQKAAEAENLE